MSLKMLRQKVKCVLKHHNTSLIPWSTCLLLTLNYFGSVVCSRNQHGGVQLSSWFFTLFVSMLFFGCFSLKIFNLCQIISIIIVPVCYFLLSLPFLSLSFFSSSFYALFLYLYNHTDSFFKNSFIFSIALFIPLVLVFFCFFMWLFCTHHRFVVLAMIVNHG
jgi:hypothetical protein